MQPADLVLEGGGVKGASLVGAVTAMTEGADPYEFHRIAGTSAGAITAAFLAAGISPADLKKIMMDEDFSTFEDEPGIFKHLKLLGEGAGLLFHEGLFAGDTLHAWITEVLAEHGVHTWGDLRLDDDQLPAERRYKLVVVVSDVSHGRELRLPWDYRSLLGVDPDRQPVADAVRASASIPFFFRPVRLRASREYTDGNGYVLCTDGGMLSNYPIDIFDRADGQDARWPTLGVKLSARSQVSTAHWAPNAGPLDLAKSLLSTMMDAHDGMHVDDPYFADRTTFVDTTGFSSTNFGLSNADKATLFDHGYAAGRDFLAGWDWTAWTQRNTARPPRPAAGPGAVRVASDPSTSRPATRSAAGPGSSRSAP